MLKRQLKYHIIQVTICKVQENKYNIRIDYCTAEL